MAEMNPYLYTEPDREPRRFWPARAACRGQQHLFDAAADGDPGAVQAALTICAACPVRADCLDHARRIRVRHGVWGGVIRGRRSGEPTTQERALALAGLQTASARRGRRAKITIEQVREIRRRADAGEPHSHIAGDLGLSQPYVSKIVRREAWKHSG